ncbi:hypothetical protein BpHYR1_003586 [Brachionus plicatilis]|uniref:Uncharacterized protein n=1 Tax=Brachionus plicatilis TaxID=10195 RepID=A0A3M7SZ57_BRAPC|nr:hypothetical protein BpHYR1_003586 [Brachionus plicatilis]
MTGRAQCSPSSPFIKFTLMAMLRADDEFSSELLAVLGPEAAELAEPLDEPDPHKLMLSG